MEFNNNIYIDDNLIYEIYNLLSFNDMIIFSFINNYTYNNYRLKNKNKIFEFLNNDYKSFRKCLQVYKYSINELNYLAKSSINNINYVTRYDDNINYYDLRFIFELIYNNYYFENIPITDKFLVEAIKYIKKCISFNRFETAYNIGKVPLLHSLSYMFSAKGKWSYI
tara:strand:+ start:30 stop:530 length:501 start_codon:yes stop_codon:yes gene_type:complete